ncbi:MAG: protease modulator HflC [Hyphomicrobiaceae bacterium]|nr:protease modulator HflC [Hyphomicrobiaceae bacterium]
MKGGLSIVFGVILAAVVFVLYQSFFILYPSHQALILQFGQVRSAVKDPGLHFKLPFIQSVEMIDKRVLPLEIPQQEVIAADQKRLVVAAFARYRIVDPVRYYQTVRAAQAADERLKTFVASNLRAVLAENTFTAVVRDQRAALMQRVQQQVDKSAADLGIDVIDVRIRRADLPEANSNAVFGRMQTERQREATEIRAQGEEASRRIRARADRDREVLVAEANRQSEELRGTGDGERNRIFAEAYGQDPNFFAFYRSMQAYENGMKAGDTRMVISPQSEFFRYFADPQGKAMARPN